MNNTIKTEAMKATKKTQTEEVALPVCQSTQTGLSPDEIKKEMQRARAKRYYERNKEKVKAAVSRWQAANRDKVREKAKNNMRSYRERNAEKVKESNRARYQQHKERMNEASKKWKQANAQRVREYMSRYMSKYRSAKKQELLAAGKKWKSANKCKVQAQGRRYAAKHAGVLKSKNKIYYIINRDRFQEYAFRKNRADVNELVDTYIKALLTRGTELKRADIPPELVALKKMHLKIQRQLNQTKP